MDKFLEGLTHCNALRFDCCQDRRSTDPDCLRKYTQGQVVTTLTTLLHTFKLADGVPLPPKPTLLPPSRGLSSKPSHFGRTRPVSVNSVQVQFTDGSSYDLPLDADDGIEMTSRQYSAAVNSVQADPRKFSSTSPCVVCLETGHSFADCPVLNDIPFLKKHHIAYCANQRRLQKMMTTRAAVNRLAAILPAQAPSPKPADETSDFR